MSLIGKIIFVVLLILFMGIAIFEYRKNCKKKTDEDCGTLYIRKCKHVGKYY